MCSASHQAVRGLVLFACLLANGCASPPADCGPPEAELPPTVAPGQTLTLELERLIERCGDGLSPPTSLESVTVDLRPETDPRQLAASAGAPVSNDFTAVVEITIPANTSGGLEVWVVKGNAWNPNLDHRLGVVEVTAGS